MFKNTMDYKKTLKKYYLLSKPGIIYANIITALAGYLFAAQFTIDWLTLAGLLLGLTLVIAGACAFNNYLDRGIDKRMQRTKNRGLVTADIGGWQALSYASVVSVLGFGLLALTQNMLTASLAVIAFVDYVVLYGLAKRYSVHGTLVGCISGSIPLVAGYTAVTNQFNVTAALLFGLMVAWQMAHFYGIALLRLKDYKAAGIPVMPAVYGQSSTKLQIVAYIGLYIGVSGLLLVNGSINTVTGVILLGLGLVWLVKALSSYNMPSSDQYGRKVFLFSLTVMLGMSFILSFDSLLG